jgi:cell division protease FtsH
MRKALRSPFFYAALALVLVVVVLLVLFRGSGGPANIGLGTYETDLAHHEVQSAVINDSSDTVTGSLAGGISYVVDYPDRFTPTITSQLLAAVPSTKVSHDHGFDWGAFLLDWLPILLIFGAFLWIINSMQGGGSRVMQFGKAKARTGSKDQPRITFADVAGVDEAVAELQEIKDFLAAPARFLALGAKIPKGVLLFGPPGTGKTLLARAVAGEANVPFYSISGSDFVEMFVGVGASRVRDLFDQAKSNAPAIVFMDEIDAVGRHRGAGLGGGHDEREQTLNQLLVEMDGFDVRGGVILIAATNRPDILDPALLRPGRFDRQIVVDRPDVNGRRQILRVHAEGKPLGPTVSLDVLAKRTPGFTGADLANLLNEAALLTARRNLAQIGMRECEEAIDRVLAGPERKTLVMSEKDKLVTAYHEAGHTIVGHVLPDADPIHKVSIVARSRSLGLTFTLPEDKFNHSRRELRAAMAMCLGGRTAEELVFDEPTTGAENDIEKATRIARAMVTEYGMSDRLGPQQLAQPGGEVFLGREFASQAQYSQTVATTIDAEVRALIDEAHDRARAILAEHRDILDRLAQELVERETLDTADLMAIIGELAPWPDLSAQAAPGGGGRPGVPVPAAAAGDPAVDVAPVPPTASRAGRGTKRAAGSAPAPGVAERPLRPAKSQVVSPAPTKRTAASRGGAQRTGTQPPAPAPPAVVPAPAGRTARSAVKRAAGPKAAPVRRPGPEANER